MTTSEIIDRLLEASPNTFKSRAEAERTVKTFLQLIKDGVENGDTVYISGFGIFSRTYRAPRAVVLPNGEQKVSVPARWVPQFRAKKAFKDQVAKGK